MKPGRFPRGPIEEPGGATLCTRLCFASAFPPEPELPCLFFDLRISAPHQHLLLKSLCVGRCIRVIKLPCGHVDSGQLPKIMESWAHEITNMS